MHRGTTLAGHPQQTTLGPPGESSQRGTPSAPAPSCASLHPHQFPLPPSGTGTHPSLHLSPGALTSWALAPLGPASPYQVLPVGMERRPAVPIMRVRNGRWHSSTGSCTRNPSPSLRVTPMRQGVSPSPPLYRSGAEAHRLRDLLKVSQAARGSCPGPGLPPHSVLKRPGPSPQSPLRHLHCLHALRGLVERAVYTESSSLEPLEPSPQGPQCWHHQCPGPHPST